MSCTKEQRKQCIYYQEACAQRLLNQARNGLGDMRQLLEQMRRLLDEAEEKLKGGIADLH